MKAIFPRLLLLSLPGLLAAPAEPPPEKTSVAVYPIQALRPADESLGPSLTGVMVYELAQSDRLYVVESSLVEKALETLGYNIKDQCDSNRCRTELGKQLQIQKMIVCHLTMSGTKYSLLVRLIDVETTRVDFSDKEDCHCSPDQLDLLASAAAAKIRNHFGENLPVPSLPAAPAGAQAPSPAQPRGLGLNTGTQAPSGPSAAEVIEVKPTAETRAASGPATLFITTIPPGAAVFLSGTEVGKSDPAFQK